MPIVTYMIHAYYVDLLLRQVIQELNSESDESNCSGVAEEGDVGTPPLSPESERH